MGRGQRAEGGGQKTKVQGSFLARVHCGFVALAACLTGDGRGSLRVTSPIEPVLKRFAGDLAQARNMGPVLEGIHREIAALRDEAIKPTAAAQPPISHTAREDDGGYLPEERQDDS